MKILIYRYPAEAAGLGHVFRCRVLADEAADRGHEVVTRVQDVNKLPDMQEAMEGYGFIPDWLVVDVPGKPPDEPFEAAEAWGAKVCLLNGIGYEQDDARADLTIVQGLAEAEHSGPKYVILRPELFTFQRWSTGRWFVFGGARGEMGLLSRFASACPDLPAYLIATRYNFDRKNLRFQFYPEFPIEGKGDGFTFDKEAWFRNEVKLSSAHSIVRPGTRVFRWMAEADRACVAMGMTVWELVALQVPAYVFSISEVHLAFARHMEEAGYLLAWPEVGLPENDEEFREFLARDYEPHGESPDGKGAERVLKLMEGDGQ